MRFASVLAAAALTAAGIALSASDFGTAPAVAASTDRPAADTFAVDLSHSNILFKCLHLGVSYQWGRFDDFEGSFTLDDDAAKSAVNITIQAASVNSNSVDRDKHLRARRTSSTSSSSRRSVSRPRRSSRPVRARSRSRATSPSMASPSRSRWT